MMQLTTKAAGVSIVGRSGSCSGMTDSQRLLGICCGPQWQLRHD